MSIDKSIKSTNLYSDNQSAICIAKDPITSQRTKHVDIKYHFIRTKIDNGTINLKYEINIIHMKLFIFWF